MQTQPEKNGAARTLVVGDIHGKLSLFQRLLEEMAYRPGEDRLILIGDLVDALGGRHINMPATPKRVWEMLHS